ncbi:MAG: hypothetical protein LBJ64_00890 [Deltaproteobacteria bacterium]|jgi:chromosome segregation ATPase|nr:hypothetical protein [Deltaproteobacteria bacterium]
MGILKIALSIASLLVILIFLILWRSAAGELETANKSVSRSQRDISALENDNKNLKAELATAQNSLKENGKTIDDLNRVNRTQKGEIDKLRKSGETMNASLEALTASLKDYENQVKALEDKHEGNCQIVQTETLLSCESDRLDALNKLGQLAGNLESVMEERDNLLTQLEQTKNALEKLAVRNSLP